jgi:hypothetical protein
MPKDNNKLNWTKEDDKKLKDNKNKSANELAALFPNRTSKAISFRKQVLGLVKKKPKWTEAEDEIIKKNNHLTGTQLVLLLPGRKKKAITSRRFRLGLNYESSYKLPEYFENWYDKKLNNNIEFKDFSYSKPKETKLKLRCIDNEKHILDRTIHYIY